MSKTIWRKNFDIKRTDYNIAAETMPGFGGLAYLTLGKNLISQCIWVSENLDNTGTYFPKNELRNLIAGTIKVILQNPHKIDLVHKKAIVLNAEYFRYAKSLRGLKLNQLSSPQLLACHKKLFNLQYQSHCWALPTTWYLDSDGEDFSKYLIGLIDHKIKAAHLDLEPSIVFSVLTTPKQSSLGQKEEEESLRIVKWIKQAPKLKHWFASQTTEELTKTFPALPNSWKRRILNHYTKWCWTPYTYLGPAYGLDYYLEVWRGLIHEDVDANVKIRELKLKPKKIQEQRKSFINKLRLSAEEKHWFDIAAEIVWLKGYRKDCYFHGFYVLDLLLAEMGRRTGLSLMQAKYLLPNELPKILKGADYADTANQRIKFSVMYSKTLPGKNLNWSGKGIKIFVGSKAKAFLRKQKFEKIVIIKTDTLTGTCACPGFASGAIKIINVPDEMGKMNQGDIMLSHTTFPALVPAMKKAAAIITEDGGITCHAAIVARELQTPCVVGCKNAVAILKDGDRVEVDANKGIVKKL
jgi:phosphohistidine swiveling domain-containing protein